MGWLTVSFSPLQIRVELQGYGFLFFMKLTLNGEIFDTSKAETIRDLLDELGIESVRVAVEVNLTIVKKADYMAFKLKDGDNVEIVNFVGGG
ncbi:MAG: sulfur carrier protein ThiS [Thermodesulfovibrionales bacterium]